MEKQLLNVFGHDLDWHCLSKNNKLKILIFCTTCPDIEQQIDYEVKKSVWDVLSLRDRHELVKLMVYSCASTTAVDQLLTKNDSSIGENDEASY